jgi:hypothetical protein
MNNLAEELAELSLLSIRRHPLCLEAVDLPKLVERFKESLERIQTSGFQHIVRGKRGQIEAAALVTFEEPSFTGAACWTGRLHIHPDAPESALAAAVALADFARTVEQDFDASMSYGYRDVAIRLAQGGLFVHAVTFLGRVDEALAKLRADAIPADFDRWGLTCAPFCQCEDKDAVVALHGSAFEERYGWFLTKPDFLVKLREDLSKENAKTESHFVIKNKRQVVGYFAGGVDPTPQWGRRAGMHFVLAHEWQGKGLSRVMYRMLLEAHARNDARVFFGGTSQPPVLKLARQLGRVPTDWIFGRKTHFPLDYFL